MLPVNCHHVPLCQLHKLILLLWRKLKLWHRDQLITQPMELLLKIESPLKIIIILLVLKKQAYLLVSHLLNNKKWIILKVIFSVHMIIQLQIRDLVVLVNLHLRVFKKCPKALISVNLITLKSHLWRRGM